MTAGERTNSDDGGSGPAEPVADSGRKMRFQTNLPQAWTTTTTDDVVEIRVMGKGASDAVLQNANGPDVIDDGFCRGRTRQIPRATSVNLATAIVSRHKARERREEFSFHPVALHSTAA